MVCRLRFREAGVGGCNRSEQPHRLALTASLFGISEPPKSPMHHGLCARSNALTCAFDYGLPGRCHGVAAIGERRWIGSMSWFCPGRCCCVRPGAGIVSLGIPARNQATRLSIAAFGIRIAKIGKKQFARVCSSLPTPKRIDDPQSLQRHAVLHVLRPQRIAAGVKR